MKSFCTVKETINKMKRLATGWKEILAKDISDKGLISKVYNEHIELNINSTNNLTKKCAENLNIHSSKDDIPMTNRYMKRW